MKPDERALKKAGLSKGSRDGLWVRGPEAALMEKLSSTQLFASDFDQCMHGSITQADVGMAIFRKVAPWNAETGNIKLFRNMARRAVPILMVKNYQSITGDIQNSRMIMMYEKLARGVPKSYFEEAARGLQGGFFKGVKETFGEFSARGVRTGVISLGLDAILEILMERIITNGKGADFVDCTGMLFDEKERFVGYDPKRLYSGNEAKRDRLKARVQEYGVSRVAVMGHDRDDMLLFSEAKKMDGVTMGFRPSPETYPLLDAAFFADDWRPVHDFTKAAFEMRRND